MFPHVRHVCQPPSHRRPRRALGANLAGQCHSFPKLKVRLTFLRQVLRIDLEQMGRVSEERDFDSLGFSRAEEWGVRGFATRSHSQECASTCLLFIQVYDHQLTNLSLSFLFRSIPITSLLRAASYHILVRFNFSLKFRSNELTPNAQPDSRFPVLSSLLRFPGNESFALVVLSRVIF